ncbi:hypothetical protein [Lacrimispora sp. 210928-DFI.3.58]|uniref:hypothetical protein n=1 Tax=Lacrimispora sp. 210928-DFI.3.58 TaxID=2883214 RepID=UPI0015B48900|nr:hypothetical protein [Lacrimispora sp. 210928-DFI.3.58]MCB7317537.1 hypothetical protein [Lacrimispora sp. 210928-DFI.3.58]
MTKHYDDYDYEEAIQEQADKLEEWELERLAEKGEACCYRTTTTKSPNLESGAVLLESQVYPSFAKKSDVPRTKKRRESKPSQKNLNDKNSRRYMIRLANINFGKGDIWATFGWNDSCMPGDITAARKDVKNFIARINYRQKKAGKPNIKYIYIIAFDGHTRPHVHILMTGKGIDRDELEELWGKCDRPNTRRIKPDDNFLLSGLATYVSNNPRGTKRWCASKNLTKPAPPTRSYSKFSRTKVGRMVKDYTVLGEEMEKAYPGYRFLDAEVKYNDKLALFYIYARLMKRP